MYYIKCVRHDLLVLIRALIIAYNFNKLELNHGLYTGPRMFDILHATNSAK